MALLFVLRSFTLTIRTVKRSGRNFLSRKILIVFARATHSIARLLLAQRGWLAGIAGCPSRAGIQGHGILEVVYLKNRYR